MDTEQKTPAASTGNTSTPDHAKNDDFESSAVQSQPTENITTADNNAEKANNAKDNTDADVADEEDDDDDNVFKLDALDDGTQQQSTSGTSGKTESGTEAGIIRRTLGSVGTLASSLGSSFPGSPHMSSIVNFSSGLFSNRSSDRDTSPPAPPSSSPSATSHKSRISMHNEVRLVDRPDLFKSLDELVPRPATQYEDPPLYLCLKIGIPKKQMSKTCPIESYSKKNRRAEYWFSIPQNRVDQLYAFFVQWSPEIYGIDDSQLDLEEQGFVVLLEGTDDMAFLDDHFDSSRHISKNWEIVNKEEAKRRISGADDDVLPIPELLDTSTILNEDHIRKLGKHLLPRAEGYPWSLIYSSDKHGFSLKTLYRSMRNVDSPVMLVVKDTNSLIFGCMLSTPLKMSDHFYGTGESFLWTFYPDFKKFVWTGNNNFFAKGNTESLAIGAGEGSFGLWLDGDLYHGRTQTCQTYDNELLTDREDFVIRGVEAWGFV